jgi:hypothetical protein
MVARLKLAKAERSVRRIADLHRIAKEGDVPRLDATFDHQTIVEPY